MSLKKLLLAVVMFVVASAGISSLFAGQVSCPQVFIRMSDDNYDTKPRNNENGWEFSMLSPKQRPYPYHFPYQGAVITKNQKTAFCYYKYASAPPGGLRLLQRKDVDIDATLGLDRSAWSCDHFNCSCLKNSCTIIITK